MNPWPPGSREPDDPTIEADLPPVDAKLAGDNTTELADVIVIEGTGTPRFPGPVGAVLTHAAIGAEGTQAALRRFLCRLPDADELDRLAEAITDDDDIAGIDAWYAERSRQRGVLAARWAVTVGAGGAGLLLLWAALGAHGMWPLIILTVTLPLVFGAAGKVMVWRRARRRGPRREGEAYCETVERGSERAPTRGLLRLVRGGRDSDLAPVDADLAPRRPEPVRPSWLTQPVIETRLKRAYPRLGNLSLDPVDGEDPDAPLSARLLGVEPARDGWQMTVELPVAASKVMAEREEVAREFGVPVDQLLMDVGDQHPGVLVLWRFEVDPLTGPPEWSGLADQPEENLWDGYELGRDLHNRAVHYHPIGHHCVTVGGTGSGKTTLMRLKAGHLVMDPHHLTVFVDPTGGEWWPYRRVALHFGGAAGMSDALEFVQWLATEEIERRSKRIAQLKQELGPMRIPELKLYDFLARDLDEDLYPITIVIEEAKRVLTGEQGDRWYEALTILEGEGRKYGCSVDLVFQNISKEEMGQGVAIRRLVTTAFCGCVREESSARMALGDAWRQAGMSPTTLRPYVHAGAFYAINGGAIRARTRRAGLLLRCRMTDDAEGEIVLRNALAVRERVRPELLPENWRRPGTGPKRAQAGPGNGNGNGTDVTRANAVEPLDLDPLRRVVEILEPNGTMLAKHVIAELADRWPVEHGEVSTINDLNELLRPFELRTRQWDVPSGGRPHQLRYSSCAKRLRELEAGEERPEAT